MFAVTDGNGYGVIISSMYEVRDTLYRYPKKTGKNLGIHYEKEAADKNRFLIVNYNDESPSKAVLTKPISEEKAWSVLKEIVLKWLIALGTHTETEANELYKTAEVAEPLDEILGLCFDGNTAVIHFGRDDYNDRYQIVPSAK